MDHSGEFPMRPVKPVDGFPEALLAAMPVDEPEAGSAPADEMVLLVDPTTRRPLAPWMSQARADQLRAVFERIEARGAAETEQARAVANGLKTLFLETSTVAGSLRALAYLFTKAVVEDGDDTQLTSASYVVIDCMETMAKRLDAVETAAEARYAPLLDGQRG